MFRKLAVIGLCWASLGPAPAAAAPVAQGAGRPNPVLESSSKALSSGDEARSLAALDQLESSTDPRAAELVDALLRRGAPTKLLLRAISVAGTLAREPSSSALAPYVKHRAANIRIAAARSLARTKGDVAIAALQSALRGNDPALRGVAATGLGALGARSAVPDLFVVLPKDVPEAASAIGSLCRGEECRKFVGLLGKLPFDVMESGILPLLLRSDSDVPFDVELQLIERLRRMATQKSNELLASALASFPSNGNPKLRSAIDAALHHHPVTNSEP